MLARPVRPVARGAVLDPTADKVFMAAGVPQPTGRATVLCIPCRSWASWLGTSFGLGVLGAWLWRRPTTRAALSVGKWRVTVWHTTTFGVYHCPITVGACARLATTAAAVRHL